MFNYRRCDYCKSLCNHNLSKPAPYAPPAVAARVQVVTFLFFFRSVFCSVCLNEESGCLFNIFLVKKEREYIFFTI